MEREKLKSEDQGLFYLMKDATVYWEEGFITNG